VYNPLGGCVRYVNEGQERQSAVWADMDNFNGIAVLVHMDRANPLAGAKHHCTRHVMGDPPRHSHMLRGEGHKEGQNKGEETRHIREVTSPAVEGKWWNVARCVRPQRSVVLRRPLGRGASAQAKGPTRATHRALYFQQ